MEKEASRRDGFSISDSKSVPNSDDGVSLMKLQSVEEAFPSKMGRRFDGGGAGGGGPTGSNSGGANEVVGHMLYYDNVSSSPLGVENFSTNSQPFDIFAAAHSSSSESPEGIMATSVAFPFTSAQWKELERQAMIYKYMIYSVPVPSDLLLPASAVDSSVSSMYSVRYTKNGDPEPGRCKRTDGKKWRCSKDVAVNQKYCERHLHRGRPRSRKPVEDKNNINGESNKKTPILNNSTASHHFSATNDKPILLFNPENDLNISKPSAPSCNRDLSMMVMESELKRQRLIETNLGFSGGGCSIYGSWSLFDQDYVDQNQLNALSSYSSFEIDAPISFIDAWSIDNGNVESSGPREPESLSPSLNLSISMASGDDQSVYWGGPLAEAFKNPASPHDSVTTVATTVESPTGVLHRTLFSHSDGSVCNSPTFPAPMSEVAFRWLN